MSSELVISCDNVGKAYQLYLRRNDQLKQTIFGHWKQFYHHHWVLKDVSFKVHRGETVGIIGRNGAGKTTLLQIICGITLPTMGSQVAGRVAPILALGAGFDHELTGRENALIGGAILGIKRSIIEARLNDVAAFADIGEFFYQPLKMYSTGMAARLAFAVCAHADADILIVDEALSVGDAAFGANATPLSTISPSTARSSSFRTISKRCRRCATASSGSTTAGCKAWELQGRHRALSRGDRLQAGGSARRRFLTCFCFTEPAARRRPWTAENWRFAAR